MFERVLEGMHRDPVWLPKLDRLGCFIRKNDTIGKFDAPEERLAMHITNNWRYNEMYANAIELAIRRIVRIRAYPLGVRLLYLTPPPIDEMIETLELDDSNPSATDAERLSSWAVGAQTVSTSKPAAAVHSKIYATVPAVLKRRRRVVLLLNDDDQHLGLLSSRNVCGQDGGMGINAGSIISLIRHLISRSGKTAPTSIAIEPKQMHEADSDLFPGFIALSPTPVLYAPSTNTTHSNKTWGFLNRKSTLHPERPVHPYYNIAAGHQTAIEQLTTVFESVILNPEFCHPDVHLYVIANGTGADSLVTWLRQDGTFARYGRLISAIALVAPGVGTATTEHAELNCHNDELQHLFTHRTRAWARGYSDELPDETLSAPHPDLQAGSTEPFVRWSGGDEAAAADQAESETEGAPGDEAASEADDRSHVSGPRRSRGPPPPAHHSRCPCHQPPAGFSWLQASDPGLDLKTTAGREGEEGRVFPVFPTADPTDSHLYSLFPILNASSRITSYQTELLLPSLVPHILRWFETVAVAGPDKYHNPIFTSADPNTNSYEPTEAEIAEMTARREENLRMMDEMMKRGHAVLDDLSNLGLENVEPTADADDSQAGLVGRPTGNPLQLNVGDRRQAGDALRELDVSDVSTMATTDDAGAADTDALLARADTVGGDVPVDGVEMAPPGTVLSGL